MIPPWRDYSDDEICCRIGDAQSVGDDHIVGLYILELQRRGVYPTDTVEGNPNDVEAMVRCWGPFWHTWREPLECPHCNADLRDHRTGPPFKREISVYNREEDRTTKALCPDCRIDLEAPPTVWDHLLKET